MTGAAGNLGSRFSRLWSTVAFGLDQGGDPW